MDNDLYSNYIRSLERIYNAVCFDIDGTKTVRNSKKIDEKAINMIIELKKTNIVSSPIFGKLDLMIKKNDKSK